MIWGWKMPASLWYFSGTFLTYLNGVNLPLNNDILQGTVFLFIKYFLSGAMNKGFEIFEIFDLNERNAKNRTTLGFYIKDNL
jgi:hypothetical protein